MFENSFIHSSSDNDPFSQLDHNSPEIADDSANPFEHVFTKRNLFSGGSASDTHFVEPHYVKSYMRGDGTPVQGYWRDGDGDTTTDLTVEQGGGYQRSNPDDSLLNNLNTNHDITGF